MRCTDASVMSVAERLAEIADILAAGVQRFLAKECKAPTTAKNLHVGLDALGGVEAPCGSHALNPKSMEPAR